MKTTIMYIFQAILLIASAFTLSLSTDLREITPGERPFLEFPEYAEESSSIETDTSDIVEFHVPLLDFWGNGNNPDMSMICNGLKLFEPTYGPFPSDCIQVFHSWNGTITSPQPRPHEIVTLCYWIICVKPGNILRLVWDRFAAEITSRCASGVRLYYNSSTLKSSKKFTNNDRSSWEFCGGENPPVITSRDSITIQLYSFDRSNVSARFWILNDDAETNCSVRMSGDQGVITTPKYPSSYVSIEPCIWEIAVQVDLKVTINLSEVKLDDTGCDNNFLEIRNGAHSTSPLLGYFCEEIHNNVVFTSDSNNMWIRYYTAIPHKGVRVTWNAFLSGCGHILRKPTGFVTSPGYPTTPAQNVDCTWHIMVNEGSTVVMHILDVDLIEWKPGFIGDCSHSYVEIFDGIPEERSSKGQFCYERHYNPITISSNKASIRLRTNWICEYCRGFQIRYASSGDQVLTGYNGIIESLNYPNGYARNLQFTWTIQASRGNTIEIDFTDFDLDQEESSGKIVCGDFVKVIVWSSGAILGNKTDLGTLCGYNYTSHISTHSDMASISMVADSIKSNQLSRGFRLEWSQKGCGSREVVDDFTDRKISTPKYPSRYADNIECEWKLTTFDPFKLKLTVEQAEIEWEKDCKFDSLRVFDGSDKNAPELVNICGRKTNRIVLTSRSNAIYIKFQSDGSITYKGFTAYVKLIHFYVCDHEYGGISGHIYSPHWPLNYRINEDCTWYITANRYHILKIIIIEIDICNVPGFGCHPIQIFEEEERIADIHGVPDTTRTIQSQGRELSVHFYSDAFQVDRGFHIYYEMVCGGTITDASGYIVTPSVIPGTGEVVNCSWNFETSLDENILLIFTKIDWAIGLHSCKENFVKVVGNHNTTIYNECCGELPPPILSTGNNLQLHVLGDLHVRVLFVQVASGCLGDGTLLEIDSIYYNASSEKCTWNILDVDGHNVSLQIKQLLPLVNRTRCATGLVEVYADDMLQGIYCWENIPTNRFNASRLFWTAFVDFGNYTDFEQENQTVDRINSSAKSVIKTELESNIDKTFILLLFSVLNFVI